MSDDQKLEFGKLSDREILILVADRQAKMSGDLQGLTEQMNQKVDAINTRQNKFDTELTVLQVKAVVASVIGTGLVALIVTIISKAVFKS